MVAWSCQHRPSSFTSSGVRAPTVIVHVIGEGVSAMPLIISLLLLVVSLSPSERTLRARIAAHESWAKTPDRKARTSAGTKAFLDKFELGVDPDGILEPAERARRAESKRKAHFARLALASAKARRLKKAS